MLMSSTPAATNRMPANRAAGRLLTAILVNMKAEPHTRYTVPRHRTSFEEWRGSRTLRRAARRSGAENPIADSQHEQCRDPLCAGQFDSKSQYTGLLADPDAYGDENTDQGLAGDQTRGKQHAIL